MTKDQEAIEAAAFAYAKGADCAHDRTKIWEPHLAGARKCLDCGKVYNSYRTPSWFIEEKMEFIDSSELERLKGIERAAEGLVEAAKHYIKNSECESECTGKCEGWVCSRCLIKDALAAWGARNGK